MSFTYLWPLALLILVPIIIILYMLKQKAEDHRFSSIMLWQEAYKNIEAKKPWEKLKNNLLMYIQILTVVGLILALMAPYLKSGGNAYSNVLIVLDNSGSMNYSYNEEKTRFEEEIDRATSYIDTLGDHAKITVISVDNKANMVCSNVEDKREVKNKLATIEPSELPGDASIALSMIESIVKQWQDYNTVIITDIGIDLKNVKADVVNLSGDVKNMSCDYVSYGYEEDKLVVMAKVTNYNAEAVNTDVNLYGDTDIIDIANVEVPANSSTVVYFKNLDFEGGYLTAEINNKDDLPNDNRAYTAVMADSSVSKVLLVTEGNLFLEKVLQTDPNVELYKTTIEDMEKTNSSEEYDIYVFDGVMPSEEPAANIIYINPGNANGIAIDGSKEKAMVTFSASDITSYIADFDFGVNSIKVMNKPEWATSYIDIGEGSGGYYGEHNGKKIVTMGFDIHDTDLALQPEYPILMSNILGYMGTNSLLTKVQLIAGETLEANINNNENPIYIRALENYYGAIGKAANEKDIELLIGSSISVDNSGVYRVSQKSEKTDQDIEEYLAVNFPVDSESVSKENVEAVRDENITTGADKKLSGGREVRNIVLTALLLLLGVEWIVYIRQH